jgi:hypothetical protein
LTIAYIYLPSSTILNGIKDPGCGRLTAGQ